MANEHEKHPTLKRKRSYRRDRLDSPEFEKDDPYARQDIIYDNARGNETGKSRNDSSGEELSEISIDECPSMEHESDALSLRDHYLAPTDSEDDDFDHQGVTTIGNVPDEWYADFPHIGYDIEGKRVLKPATQDELEHFLSKMDDPEHQAKLTDHVNHRDVTLSPSEIEILRKLKAGWHPDGDFDPCPEFPDFFTQDVMVLPLSAAPEPKRRFVPSRWEHKKVMKIVRAIRQGLIVVPRENTPDKKGYSYDLWASGEQPRVPNVPKILAPKMKLPTNLESYNPPQDAAGNGDKDIQRYQTMRSIPGYSSFIQERFSRCLDLYLCPRAIKKRVLRPEAILEEFQDPRELEPFPKACSISYTGHMDVVRSISVHSSGQYVASGSDDKTVCVWEVMSGRRLKRFTFEDPILCVAWNPNPDLSLVAVATGKSVYLIPVSYSASEEVNETTKRLLEKSSLHQSSNGQGPVWENEKSGEDASLKVQIKHSRPVTSVVWHKKGDYFASLCPQGGAEAIMIHQLSKKQSQKPFSKSPGLVQKCIFHPTKPFFFVATQRHVRVYNLVRQEMQKCLMPGVKWISSMDVHPKGDHVLIGSYDKRACWFDLDLAVKPFKVIRFAEHAVRDVAFHERYPLFATCCDDGRVHVFHGMVYDDLMQNPKIVPLKIIQAHQVQGRLGAIQCEFHPHQPWLFTSGADHTIQLIT